MKRCLLFGFLLLVAACRTIDIPTLVPPPLPIESDNLAYNYIKNGQLLGLSAGVMMENKVVWQNGFGFSDVEKQILADSSMVHRIASISKPMTSVAIMQLVEKDKLQLDIPIQTYLPNYPRHKEGDITIRHLLNHTSGIKNYKYLRRENRPTDHYNSLGDAIKLFQNRNLKHTPGTKYSYASYNYTLIGAIIEKVTGQTYSEYMEQYIWSTNNMLNTSLEEQGKTYPNKAKLYKKIKNGFKKDRQTDLSIKYPAGGIQSTVGDLLRFGKAMNENTLISAQSKMESFKGPKSNVRPLDYALGWLALKSDKHGMVHFHDGHQSGTSTFFIVVPSRGFVVAVLTNSSKSSEPAQELAWELMDLYLD